MKYLVLTLSLMALLSCSPKRERGMSLLAYIIATQPAETGEKSIVILEKTSDYVYSGTCYDAFYGVTASAYYNVYYKEMIPSQYIRVALSNSSCSDLSFSGGYENKTEEGFKMDIYKCGLVPKSCSSSARKAVGF